MNNLSFILLPFIIYFQVYFSILKSETIVVEARDIFLIKLFGFQTSVIGCIKR